MRKSFDLTVAAGHLAKEVSHLDRGHRRFITLVTRFYTRPIDRLLNGLGCDDSEDHRDARLQSRLCDTARGLSGDVIKMRRLTTDDDTERDDRVKFAALSRLERCQRQFEGARNAKYLDRVRVGTSVFKCVQRSFKQPRCEELVPAA